jgi:hypothetical protein
MGKVLAGMEEVRNVYRIIVGKHVARYQLGDFNVNRLIKLIWILKKWVARLWTSVNWHRFRASGRLL